MRRGWSRIMGGVVVSAVAALVVVVTVQAGGPPSLDWSPSTGGSFDYGLTGVGKTAAQTFTLSNSGGSASAALSVTLSGPAAFTITEDNCSGTSLGPRKSCTVTVEYAPTASGPSGPATLNATGKKAAASADLTLTGSAALMFVADGPTVPGLSGLNENPQHPQSTATGTTTVSWDTTTNTMIVNVTFTGLTTPNTAAHIHCCATAPTNAGVATTTPTFTGFPSGVTSGSYTHTFDMNDAASYNPAFVSLQGSVANAAAALLAGLQAGRAYMNIHTQMFGGGEIRGFMHPA
jgi:CHRD domain/Cep192 domain 4